MRFRERVQVPPTWWVFAALCAATLGGACGFYLGRVFALAVGVPLLVFVGLAFLATSYVIEVDETELRVGRAVIGRGWIGAVRPLDAVRTGVRSGVGADARAHLVLRPWISTTVELTLADPADPVPYWLVSTRRPGALATALGWVSTPDAQRPESKGPVPKKPDPQAQRA
ncbi:MAG TPA: DUF3093 domain-containing protein [Friedmanniella sp.]